MGWLSGVYTMQVWFMDQDFTVRYSVPEGEEIMIEEVIDDQGRDHVFSLCPQQLAALADRAWDHQVQIVEDELNSRLHERFLDRSEYASH